MSFSDLTQAELYRIAVEGFAVDVKKTDNKQTIINALETDGVTWEIYQQQSGQTVGTETKKNIKTKEEEVNTNTEDLYLIKMNRPNISFEFRGYEFTDKHPFVAMPAREADLLLKTERGFAIATPSEAKEFYS